MEKSLNVNFEKGVRFLAEHLPVSDESSRKPLLFHDIRVGVYLYNNGYSEEVILAGLLHDAIEWSTASEQMLRDQFGEKILALVLANTKDDSIPDKHEKTDELICRCVQYGQEALIIKSADILDSFKWYSEQENISQLKYCMRNANAIFKYKKNDFNDKIFAELEVWQEKYKHIQDD